MEEPPSYRPTPIDREWREEMTDTVTTQVKRELSGNTLLLTLDGPKSRNAVSPPVYAALQEQLIQAADDPAVRAIVLSGANGFFCSGGDVNNLKRSASQPLHEVSRSTDGLNAMIKWVRACPKPVIAAVEGGAAGVGISLALACDLIVASQAAKFTVAYVRIGLTPDGGVTHFLSAGLPRQLVTEMCLLGKPVVADVLAHHGLINRVVPEGSALDAALELSSALAQGPAGAMAKIKQLIEVAPKNDLATHLDAEARGMNQSRYTAEAKEGTRAFLEKRKPDFNVGN